MKGGAAAAMISGSVKTTSGIERRWTRLEGWMRSGKLCVLVQRHVDVTQGKPRAADRGLKCRVHT